MKQHTKNHLLNIYHYKSKQKKSSPCENHDISHKRKDLNTAAKLKDSQIFYENQTTFNKTKEELTSAYEAEHSKYLNSRNQVIEISAANKKSSITLTIINEIIGRKNSNSAKLKPSKNEERIKL